MRRIRADLHIHSVLSPCTDLGMSPEKIVAGARARGLDLIAVADHNAGWNGSYVRRAARGRPVVICAMEIQSEEEVEVLALFPDERTCQTLSEEIERVLPDIFCDPETFGDQLVVDDRGEIVRRVDRLLLSPVPWPLGEVVRRVRDLGGLAIPAHVDRVPGGLLGVLGLLPEGDWPALELAPWTPVDEACARWPELRGRALLRSSDAHSPGEIGRAWTELAVKSLDVEGLGEALTDPGRVRPSPPF